MSNRPKIHATNAINSIRQYRCTNVRVSNYIKISTVVDNLVRVVDVAVSNYIKISTVVDWAFLLLISNVSNYIKISTVVDLYCAFAFACFKLH